MENALIALVAMVILGIILYIRLWWDGPGISFKFTKWYFGIALIAALIVAAVTFFMSI